ncbi:MAG: hypothetical protein CVU61_00570 [Deltaproteobacteria bacterium HGW-Deltaproteobacteria-19]|nr:MAG: hypothetical protein CVU61_00570 [Deltaproteobacteria bacterium HGW-Deltaproteobacteria-19]
MSDIELKDFLGRRTLIVGDINAGKTFRTGEILAAFCGAGLGGRIVILDLAPEIPEKLAAEKGLRGAGGRLSPPPGRDVPVFEASPVPPRLSSRTEAEALEKAHRNRLAIDALFPRVSETSRDILFINDVSLYLQSGNAEDLISFLHRFGTVIANGYWGNRLGGGSLTDREKEQMKKLMAGFEIGGRVILLEPI